MNMPKFTSLFKQLSISVLLIVLSVSAEAVPDGSANEPINQGQLEQILAPIALYPDTILSHILVAATYPLEVVQAERWTARNTELKGAEAVAAVDNQEWDPSVRALVAFPQILKRMSEDLDWTRQLGNAFLQDEQQMLASIQTLRKLAAQEGSLEQMQNVSVVQDEKSIVIESREREVVYVPYYDTRVVYGPWRWQHYDPIFWDYPYYDQRSRGSYYTRNRHSSFFWGPRVSLSFGFFFNTFHWQDRHIVRIASRNYLPNRYYSRSAILSHGHAERWVHNSGRGYGRSRYNENRDYRGVRHQNRAVRSNRREQERSQARSNHERVRGQLSAPGERNQMHNRHARQRPLQNSRRSSYRTSHVQLNQAIENSSATMSNRGNSRDGAQRSTQRNQNRELERQRSARESRPTRESRRFANGHVTRQRPTVTPQVNRPAPAVTRSVPRQRQAQSRPTQSRPSPSRQSNNARQMDKPKPRARNARSGTRQERQLRR